MDNDNGNDNDHHGDEGGGGIIHAEDYFYNEEELSDEDNSSDEADSSDDDEGDFGGIINAHAWFDNDDELLVRCRDETILMITQNDPCLTSVDLMECAWHGDGGEFGASIGRNHHLTKFWMRSQARPGLQFFHGFALNRSIETLKIGGDARILLPLIPFFKNNPALKHLEIVYSCFCTASLLTWASMIRQFNTLEEFDLNLTHYPSNITGCKELIEALACHAGLRKIKFKGIAIGRDGFVALAALLLSPQCILKELDLKDTDAKRINIDDEGARILSSGLNGNNSLTDLALSGSLIGQPGWQSIFDTLKNPNCRLENLYLKSSSLDNSLAVYLADALQNSSTLKRFRLIDSSTITNTSWRQLFGALLQRQNSTLECLCLSSRLYDGTIQLLAPLLAINSKLIELDLSNIGDSVTESGWDALFIVLRSSTSALKLLDLSSNDITDNSIGCLVDALANNSSLRKLEFNHITLVTPMGWQMFSIILQCQTSMLEKIGLRDNTINDQVLVSLTNALASNTKLRELNLRNCYSTNNIDITSRGLQTFSAVFENPITALERLDFASEDSDRVVVDNRAILFFANALADNNTLRELIFDSISYERNVGHFVNSITSVGYDAISRTLCNPSTILDTYNSNHTLSKFGKDDEITLLPSNLRSLLRYNREESIGTVARMKIIKTHFSGGDIKTQVKVFTDMESNVLPTAIAWIVQDDGHHKLDDLLFALLRNVTHLYDTTSTNKKRKTAN